MSEINQSESQVSAANQGNGTKDGAGEPPNGRPQDALHSPQAAPAGPANAAGPQDEQVIADLQEAAAAGDVTDSGELSPDPSHYLNRELSLVAFNKRVLEEARDPSNPLLERVKFLAIVESNLDEFYMVRVAGLKQQVEAGVVATSADGLTPAEQLAAVRKAAHKLQRHARKSCLNELREALESEGISVLQHGALSDKQRENAARYFDDVVFPVLTPLAFDPSRPFPHISNLSVNLAVVVRDGAGITRFARVKIPSTLPRLVPLKRSSGGLKRDGTVARNHYFVRLEQLVLAHLPKLFPGMDVLEAQPFRVTRDADTEIQETEAADLLISIEQTVRDRRFASVVRLEVPPTMSKELRDLLAAELQVDKNDILVLEEPLGLRDLMALTAIERFDLKDIPLVPFVEPALDVSGAQLFDAIRRKNYLVHHPYDSFAPVVEFLRAAAEDPNVLAIKQTLYRVGKNSPIVEALLQARANGKQVAVLVELKARFDEESNIEWARQLEREGVHVAYGLLGLKTHAKIALVVRQEGEAIRRYVHLSTGNYNHFTANLYTDIGLFTTDPDIGADATDLFNYLTGYSAKQEYRKLLVAPINLRAEFSEKILREIQHAEAGRPSRIVFQCNSLVDPELIHLLYRASNAGVQVDLIIRGACCLRPGVPGLSENIQVRSIIGRFLEHSRVYAFENGGEPEVYSGSADLMPRNIDRRVETLFPVEDPEAIAILLDEVLNFALVDNQMARVLDADGKYKRLEPEDGDLPVSYQQVMAERRHAAGQKKKRGRFRV